MTALNTMQRSVYQKQVEHVLCEKYKLAPEEAHAMLLKFIENVHKGKMPGLLKEMKYKHLRIAVIQWMRRI